MIVVAVVDNPDPEVREEDYAATMMAIENLALAAVERGLGTHLKTGGVMKDDAARAAAGVLAVVAEQHQGFDAQESEPRDFVQFLGRQPQGPQRRTGLDMGPALLQNVEVRGLLVFFFEAFDSAFKVPHPEKSVFAPKDIDRDEDHCAGNQEHFQRGFPAAPFRTLLKPFRNS